MNESSKTRVAVLFGGRSTEHEISIITGLQVLDAFDSTQFETLPVYVDPEGFWYTGPELRKRENYIHFETMKEHLCRVRLTSDLVTELIEVDAKPRGWFRKPAPRRFPVDVFFPAFHGTFGEDGCIQGFLEFIGAAYTGCGPRAAAIGMNKHTAKQTLSAQGIPVLPGVLLDRRDWDAEKAHETTQEILRNFSLPLMVKPCNLGSSIGISSARTEEQLMVSIAGAFVFDYQVIVEPLLEEMYELNISVLENNPPRVSAIERPKSEEKLLTFEQKYLKGNKKISASDSGGMASMQRDLNPSDVPEEIQAQVRAYAQKAFSGLDCRGLVRFDFLVDKTGNKVYFNEVNTLPGSFSYYLWEKADPPVPFTPLLTELVRLGQKRWQENRQIRRQIERRILKD
ncbi:MAG TPA: D-alanine--D-alanine ligase family protein [bacterium]|nr:D-alanine--D-alanine ligase [Candidatus Omnitrophota bacterium]HOJ58774.1 D-alanine--D-alanine ligase family protein [bacterium]HOL93948.1 D-alanine--D-alanine ligase family protein [bacterium]HPO99216.1 D-alanine--D-alanine ligase family protein [bacterium]